MPTEQLQYWIPLLTDHSPYLFAIIDSQHRYVIVNQGYCNLSGLERNDLVGRNDSEVLEPHITTLSNLIISVHSKAN